VYHHKDERTFVGFDGKAQMEGHHCKLVSAGNCVCRCHRVFRHEYNPALSTKFLYGCGPLTATACNPSGNFDAFASLAPTKAPTKAPTAVPNYAGKTCYDNWQANKMCTDGNCAAATADGATASFVLKPTHAGASNDEWKVWCSGGASKGHYMGVCHAGKLYTAKRFDPVASFDCGVFAAQQNGLVTTCGYWGRQCTSGITDFAAGSDASGADASSLYPGGAHPYDITVFPGVANGKFPAYYPGLGSGITDPAPFREWDTSTTQIASGI
jgi:hypothetical protein